MAMVAKMATSKAEFDGMCYRGGNKERFWPTPAAVDYKGARKPETIAATGRNPETNSLRDCVEFTNPAPLGKPAGSLNPTWVEWLMGYPEGWTDLEDSETQSSRKSRK